MQNEALAYISLTVVLEKEVTCSWRILPFLLRRIACIKTTESYSSSFPLLFL